MVFEREERDLSICECELDTAVLVGALLEVLAAAHVGEGRRVQISRSTNQLRQSLTASVHFEMTPDHDWG